MNNLRLITRLFLSPGAAMSEILDQGSLLFACAALIAVNLPLRLGFGLFAPLFVLAAVYVPATLLLCQAVAGIGGSAGAVFQRDYSPLLTCAGMAATAASLPLVLARWTSPAPLFLPIAALSAVYFLVLMFFAVRTVLGTGNGAAAGVVLLSWLPLVAVFLYWGQIRFLLGWLTSPFFLLLAYFYLGREIGNLGAGLRQRQQFRRMLEAATVNPHDAEAQYQLGLVYQQRRQYTEAIQRFQNAVAIDPRETDAHFQLGRIARSQGRLRDALAHFQTVVDLDEKHSQNEVLRELGAVYLAARQSADARNELEVYVERRPYDPEGLVYYGQALEGTARPDDARDAYRRAFEAARTAPGYRRRLTDRWSRLAQKQLRKLESAG